MGFKFEIGEVSPPLFIFSETEITAGPEFLSLVTEVLPVGADIIESSVTITRHYGVLESLWASGRYILPADTKSKEFEIPLQPNSIWFKLSDQITLLVAVVIACLCNLGFGRSPGKFVARLRFHKGRPDHPVLREVIKTIPLTFTALLTSPAMAHPNFDLLSLETAGILAQVGALGGLALMIVFWLWPLGAETRRFLWSPSEELSELRDKTI